jgi:tetratricopeptide (TPR) repeat protein
LASAVALQENEASGRRYTIANGVMESRIQAREAELREGNALIEGNLIREDYVSHHPTQAAAALTQLDASIEADAAALQNLIGQYNAEPASVAASDQVRPLRDTALAMQSRLTTTRSQGRSQAASARSQSEQAASLRRQGAQLLTEARTLLNQSDFNNARERLVNAGAAYDRSLDLEDDEATWVQRNTVLPSLGDEIATALNRWVIDEVNDLLTQISVAYFGNDFELAQNLVSRAENTWKLTQPEAHPEITNWEGMIRVGMRAGRTIPVTAPLYAEMSQLLSEARRNYEAGRAVMDSSPDEGRQKMDLARENINRVKLIYPMNETAGLLDLLIEQQLDPAEFTRTFAERVNAAIVGTRRRDIESYNMLLNLRNINPQYPNIAAIIFQAEIDVGLRRPPVDPRVIAQSNELTEAARAIINSRNIARMDEAKANLTQALRLNPENQVARALFAEASAAGNVGPPVLDSDAQRKYQQALAALSQSNFLGAITIINEIYARNPRYRYHSGLRDVETRARNNL